MENSTLYIIGTPIGNLKDITLRALDTLKEVDILLVEDTRQTIKLLNHFNIKKKMISYHKFNEREKINLVINILKEGKSIGLVSDAGMPVISDPGDYLIKELTKQNFKIEIIPGVTAITTAIIKSNLDTASFIFEGFLPINKKLKKERLNYLSKLKNTLVFYEAPHKLEKTLNDILEVMGDRNITIARELTKLNEQFIYGSVSEILNRIQENKLKGEMVIMVEGNTKIEEIDTRDNIVIVKELIKDGIDKKEAIKKVAKIKNISKNIVYQDCLEL